MEHVPEGEVGRPAPTQPVVDRLRVWANWFGTARLVVSAISMVVVCAGALWLIRVPSPPAEAVLPMAGGGTTAPTVTLLVERPAADAAGPATPEEAETSLVHVAGAVASPGVYVLDSNARVSDAVEAAGGATAEAELDLLNLAARVVDGTRVYVPGVGEAINLVAPLDPVDAGEPVAAGPVDINVADVVVLQSLPGVGPATAAAIVAERERNGPFLVVDDLERVPGIGPAKLAALRDLVIA